MLFVFLVEKVTLGNNLRSGFLIWGVEAKYQLRDLPCLVTSPSTAISVQLLLLSCYCLLSVSGPGTPTVQGHFILLF